MFTVSARHNRLLAIPAALYAVNNSLKFAMQLFFKPTTAKMLGNLKARSPSPFLPTNVAFMQGVRTPLYISIAASTVLAAGQSARLRRRP